jgi:hypothetical protein
MKEKERHAGSQDKVEEKRDQEEAREPFFMLQTGFTLVPGLSQTGRGRS